MSISSETDPVETIRLILDADTNSWSSFGGEPDYIERLETVEPSTKESRASNGKTAVYVWSPAPGPISVMGAEGDDYEANETIQCDIWVASHSDANNIASDVVQLVLDYYADNESSSQWVDIRASEVIDNTGGAFYTGAHYEIAVQVTLKGVRSIS